MNCALILGYHRVVNDSSWDPNSMCVRPTHFAEHLEAIRKYANPISLKKLTEGLRNDNVPPQSVVLTFDDGYADVLYNARPLLEAYQVPATVFVSTGYLGREFWWDELMRLILKPSNIPDRISISLNGSAFEWASDKTGNFSTRDEVEVRKRLFLLLYKQLLPMPPEAQQNGIEQLQRWFKAESIKQSKSRVLTANELVKLTEGNLIDIGAHTINHTFLATLPERVQIFEIEQSKATLEDILTRPVRSFSYPNGSSSKIVTASVKRAGFVCACTSNSDVVQSGSNIFHLPRFWVSNKDGQTFSRWLNRWIHP